MMQIMPYIMTERNGSCVYYKTSIRLENVQRYIIQKRREGIRITLFNVIVAAFLRTVKERPKLNRFVAGRRLYAHKDVEVLYVVKQEMSDEGVESVARVKLDPASDILQVKSEMETHIRALKEGQLKEDDRLVRLLTKFPRWSVRFLYGLLKWLDFNGSMPKFLIEMLPFYSTIFISHLGTLGINSAFHHLYELGTTSIFLTIGRPYEKAFKGERENEVSWKRVVDLSFTIDERICDGYYLAKSLRLFEQLMENPNFLEETEGLSSLAQEDELV